MLGERVCPGGNLVDSGFPDANLVEPEVLESFWSFFWFPWSTLHDAVIALTKLAILDLVGAFWPSLGFLRKSGRVQASRCHSWRLCVSSG